MYRYSWKGFQICIRHLNQLLYIKTTEISQIASKRPIVSLGTSAAGKTVRCTITSNGTLFRAPFAPLLWRHCHSTNSKPKEGTSRAGPDHISAQIKEQLTWSGLAHSVLLQGRQPSKSADSQGRIGAMKRSGEVSGSSKKKKVVSPVTIYRKAIQQAASQGDVRTAFKTFDEAKNEGVKLTPDCFITLLFLASGGDSWERYVPGYNRVEKAGGSEDAFKDYMSRCDDILDDMKREGYAAVEMCYTALARRDAVLGHADAAFQRALLVEEEGLTPRLRCYLPALTAYAAKGDAKGAYNTYCTFLRSGLEPTETEFEKLVDALGRDNGEEDTVSWSVVTAVLNHMASETTVLQNSTITSLEQLFKSRRAKRALKKGTEWKVEMAQVTDEGYCASCDDHLEAIDLTKEEYAEFANGIAALAAKQEKHPNDFKKFLSWLQRHGPFGIVIDAANVAFFGQNFDAGGFNFAQIAAVLDRVKEEHPDRRPLVVLHTNRTRGGPAQAPSAKSFLKKINDEKCFYAAPQGSNDDWYWMYAAVSCGQDGLLISNDEMRDHLFNLLAPKYFSKWKQRHQMRYSFSGDPSTLQFQNPPPFTTCSQNLKGSWMFPSEDGQWLCCSMVSDEGTGLGE